MSNELGKGNLDRAKKAVVVTLKLSILLALKIILGLAFGHDTWVGFFGGNHELKKAFASLTPLLGISIAINSIQVVLSGSYRINYFLALLY